VATAPDVSRALIRVLRTRDLPALERLVAELQDFERGIDQRILPGSAMAAGYTRAMLSACASQAGTIFVAEVGGDVVGFAAVRARVPTESLDEPPGTYALLSDLVVSESHRGVGIGRALIEASEAHARGLGASELRIAVLAKNAAARGLYVATGFSPYLEVLTKRLTGDGG
jgi:ribosomal protein S18 acetylase RimI-like enzyme